MKVKELLEILQVEDGEREVVLWHRGVFDSITRAYSSEDMLVEDKQEGISRMRLKNPAFVLERDNG